MAAERIDLTERPAIVLRLLDEQPAWRSRVVEQVDVDRSFFGRTTRALQVAPIRPFIGDLFPYSTELDTAKIILPVAVLPKGPLVNFDIVAPRGQAFLLKRGVIAEYEAQYVEFLAESAGVSADSDTQEFLRAITEFTPGTWESKYYSGNIGKYKNDLHAYLHEGLDLEFSDETFDYWQSLDEEIGHVVGVALNEGLDYTSSAEGPLLATPLMSKSIDTVDDLTRRLESLLRYTRAIELNDGPNSSALEALGDYGRRYEALVECEVPLDDSFHD